jgi:hypothetical protein
MFRTAGHRVRFDLHLGVHSSRTCSVATLESKASFSAPETVAAVE